MKKLGSSSRLPNRIIYNVFNVHILIEKRVHSVQTWAGIMHCRRCSKAIPSSSSDDDHRPWHIKHMKITVFVRLLFPFPFLLKIIVSKCHNHCTGAIHIQYFRYKPGRHVVAGASAMAREGRREISSTCALYVLIRSHSHITFIRYSACSVIRERRRAWRFSETE